MKVQENKLTLLCGMSTILEAMMDDIARAISRVWIESYILRDDKLGRRLAAALAAASARGANVRLLFDALGSIDTPPAFIEELRRSGVDAKEYRPLRRSHLLHLFPRDHVRILLMDDIAYTGGSAWGDEWLPIQDGGKGWHDVCVRLCGPAVLDFERIFEARWRSYPRHMLEQAAATSTDPQIVYDLASGARPILEAYLEGVRSARRRIWIENAYFFPPRELRAELVAAVRRGVQVRLLVPGRSDRPHCARAARGEYRQWLGFGIEVFEYQSTVMHSKIAVIDDVWCTVGSFNINPVAAACAHDLNVIVRDRAFVENVAMEIDRDFARSHAFTLDEVQCWPRLVRCARFLSAKLFRLLERMLERQAPFFMWSPSARDARSRRLAGRRRATGASLATDVAGISTSTRETSYATDDLRYRTIRKHRAVARARRL